MLSEIILSYNDYAASKNGELLIAIKNVKEKLVDIEKGISNIVNVVMQTGSLALSEKLKELESDKLTYERLLANKEKELSKIKVSKQALKKAFTKAKQMLEYGTLANRKAIIQTYVKKVTVYKDSIEMEFNVTDGYTVTEKIDRNELKNIVV